MKIAESLPATPNGLRDLIAQIGASHAICKCAWELTGLKTPDDFDSQRVIPERFAGCGRDDDLERSLKVPLHGVFDFLHVSDARLPLKTLCLDA